MSELIIDVFEDYAAQCLYVWVGGSRAYRLLACGSWEPVGVDVFKQAQTAAAQHETPQEPPRHCGPMVTDFADIAKRLKNLNG